MIGVLIDMRLQQYLFLLASHTATIDEISYYMPNLRHMCVRRDVISIRQHKSRKPFGIRFERIL